ncbi:hypothetical protein [Caulobacter vibrioides]|uniref:hypothetical protein n=1 Tax=Caulobacter vibrioides TaxID=155892 RepID=UPI000BB50651|nr:hypothetical protein [Caulobacter vibrioides]ATC25970.1 hypothetical protein CA608_16235 [Caulobacter vibrioides]PLR16389.1 hypothetical protein CVUC_00785 [Caulobacter vibrioides]
MARTEIKFDDYKLKAFLDANIILECRPLAELPWDEIVNEGPIIALITPTGMKEIDAKKQDGRIGKRAREFNRLIAPVAAGGPPIVIREKEPRVELALSRATRIPWDQYDELDRDDGDSRIVAEALHAKDMNSEGKLIISHDIKPIAFASGYDLKTLHVSDSWLRPREPGPSDKENQKLKQQLAAFEATQPKFDISIELLTGEPVTVLRIEDLKEQERADIQRKIHELNPPAQQHRDPYGLSGIGSYDHSYDDRFLAYRKRISKFMTNYSQRLERLFNQTGFAVKVVNSGKLQAENLLVEVTVSNGWLHDRYAMIAAQGPSAPSVRSISYFSTPDLGRMISPRIGRHEFEFKEDPNCGPLFSVTCADFRHGQVWSFEGVIGIDPRGDGPTTVHVEVTASNYRGTAELNRQLGTKIETVHISTVVDMDTLLPIAPIPMQKHIDAREYDALDFKAFGSGTGE